MWDEGVWFCLTLRYPAVVIYCKALYLFRSSGSSSWSDSLCRFPLDFSINSSVSLSSSLGPLFAQTVTMQIHKQYDSDCECCRVVCSKFPKCSSLRLVQEDVAAKEFLFGIHAMFSEVLVFRVARRLKDVQKMQCERELVVDELYQPVVGFHKRWTKYDPWISSLLLVQEFAQLAPSRADYRTLWRKMHSFQEMNVVFCDRCAHGPPKHFVFLELKLNLWPWAEQIIESSGLQRLSSWYWTPKWGPGDCVFIEAFGELRVRRKEFGETRAWYVDCVASPPDHPTYHSQNDPREGIYGKEERSCGNNDGLAEESYNSNLYRLLDQSFWATAPSIVISGCTEATPLVGGNATRASLMESVICGGLI